LRGIERLPALGGLVHGRRDILKSGHAREVRKKTADASRNLMGRERTTTKDAVLLEKATKEKGGRRRLHRGVVTFSEKKQRAGASQIDQRGEIISGGERSQKASWKSESLIKRGK